MLWFFQILLCCSIIDAIPPRSPLNSHLQLYRKVLKSSFNDDKIVQIVAQSKEPDISKITLNAFELCLCGAFATAFGDFIMHPLDTIKVMQQSGGGLNLINTAKQILEKSGPLGFYQGVIPYITADGLR
jgi:hypothetical protein